MTRCDYELAMGAGRSATKANISAIRVPCSVAGAGKFSILAC